jgi:hypothetical protein
LFFCKEELGDMANYRIVWIVGVVFVLAAFLPGSALKPSAQEKVPAADEMEHGMPRGATPGANSVANQQVSRLAPPQESDAIFGRGNTVE